MSYATDKSNLLDDLKNNLYDGEDASETGFTENFSVNFTTAWQQEMSISKLLMESDLRDRNHALKGMLDDGTISEDDAEMFAKYSLGTAASSTGMGAAPSDSSMVREYDYTRLAEWVNQNLDDKILTDKMLDTEMKAEIMKFEKSRQDIDSRSTMMGTLGGFLGGTAPTMLDPPNLAASVIIPGAGQAATIWGSIRHAAKIGAAQSALAESFIQPQIMDWKNEVGLNYTFADAVTNGTLGTLLGGTFSAGIGGGTHFVRAKFGLKADADAPDTTAEVTAPATTAASSPEDFVKSFMDETVVELNKIVANKLPRGEVKKLNAELRSLEAESNAVTVADVDPQRGVPARQAKQNAVDEYNEKRHEIFVQQEEIRQRLELSRVAGEAQADLSRIQQGIIPDEYQQQIDESYERVSNTPTLWVAGIRTQLEQARKSGDMDRVEALETVESIAIQAEAEYRNAPNRDITPEAHDRLVGQTGDAIQRGETPTPDTTPARSGDSVETQQAFDAALLEPEFANVEITVGGRLMKIADAAKLEEMKANKWKEFIACKGGV